MDINAHLFVYGSLLSSVCHPMGTRLRGEARLVGAAMIEGRLYSLGRYPALVQGQDGPYSVHGEVYALTNPVSSLAWLDRYEGIVPGRPEESPYGREERPVCLASGASLIAWVYLYRRSVRMRPEVPGGRWVPPRI
jgi:gamma-glutamylcyclotransferase (GGCT)/AIG2-like uncharacterized protein YtfP